MKNLLIEGLEKSQDALTKMSLKGGAVMVLGSLATVIGINAMLAGQEKMVKANTMSEVLDTVKGELTKENEEAQASSSFFFASITYPIMKDKYD